MIDSKLHPGMRDVLIVSRISLIITPLNASYVHKVEGNLIFAIRHRVAYEIEVRKHLHAT